MKLQTISELHSEAIVGGRDGCDDGWEHGRHGKQSNKEYSYYDRDKYDDHKWFKCDDNYKKS